MTNKEEIKITDGDSEKRVSLTVSVPRELYLKINDKRGKTGRSVISIGEELFRQWVEGERKLADKPIPDEFLDLARIHADPKNEYESKLIRASLEVALVALRRYRAREGRDK